jgi:hypothetical protein
MGVERGGRVGVPLVAVNGSVGDDVPQKNREQTAGAFVFEQLNCIAPPPPPSRPNDIRITAM